MCAALASAIQCNPISASLGLRDASAMTHPPGSAQRGLAESLGDEQTFSDSDLRRRSAAGGAFSFATQGCSVALQLVSTMVLARLLGPEAYGVLAMAGAVTAFAGIFRDFGLSSSTIQQAVLTHGQLSTLFWINMAIGGVLTALVALFAPLVASFYGRPELTAVTRVLSLTFLIGAFGAQHNALLARRMLFGRQMAATLGGALISFAVAVTLALRGFGYWSLVGSTVCGGLATSSLLSVVSGWRPGRPARGGLGVMIAFGANITAFEFVNYFSRNLDSILIGRVWGDVVLGLYSRAYQLLMVPIVNLRGPLLAVAFPAMSRLQGRPVAYRSYYRTVVALLAFMSMPLTAFLFVTSDVVIDLVLGSQWRMVGPIFSLLALTAFIQPVISLTGLVCLSLGMGKRYFWLGATNALAVSVGFLLGVKWGAAGIATAYAIVTYLGVIPLTIWAFHGTPLRLLDLIQSCFRPLLASLAAAMGVGILRSYSLEFESWLTLLVAFPVFGLSYFGVIFALPGGGEQIGKGLAMVRAMRAAKE